MSHLCLEKPQFTVEIWLEIRLSLYLYSQWGRSKWISVDAPAQVYETTHTQFCSSAFLLPLDLVLSSLIGFYLSSKLRHEVAFGTYYNLSWLSKMRLCEVHHRSSGSTLRHRIPRIFDFGLSEPNTKSILLAELFLDINSLCSLLHLSQNFGISLV